MSLTYSVPADFVRKVTIYDYAHEPDRQYFDTGKTTSISLAEHGESYAIHNLRSLSDGSMAAEVIILLGDITDDPILTEMEWLEGYPPPTGTVQIPVRIYEDNGWKIEETGEYNLYVAGGAKDSVRGIWLDTMPYAPRHRYEATGESGTVVKESLTEHYINSRDVGLFGVQSAYSKVPDPNAEFTHVQEVSEITYTFGGTPEEKESISQVILQVSNMRKSDWKPYFIDDFSFAEGSWGSEFGKHSGQYTMKFVGKDWNGIVSLREHKTFAYKDFPDHGGGVQIRWNEDVVDEMILQEVRE